MVEKREKKMSHFKYDVHSKILTEVIVEKICLISDQILKENLAWLANTKMLYFQANTCTIHHHSFRLPYMYTCIHFIRVVQMNEWMNVCVVQMYGEL